MVDLFIDLVEIGRAHVWTPVTQWSRMPSSAWKKKGQNPRTNGKSKAIQTNSHKEAYTYTLPKRGKGNIYIYIYIYLYIYKGREQPNQWTNLPTIINSKYWTKINIKPETN